LFELVSLGVNFEYNNEKAYMKLQVFMEQNPLGCDVMQSGITNVSEEPDASIFRLEKSSIDVGRKFL
jgi:hypothetical protein